LNSYAGVVKLTAIFESWHIGDGNYPPLRRGQQVNLSFEVDPSAVDPAVSGEVDSFVHLGDGEYDFIGTILRIYPDDSDAPVVVARCGDFHFYMNRPLRLTEGERLRGRGMLLLDHYLWVEFLDRYSNPPDLFYQLIVERIRRVQIPLSFIARHGQAKSLPTSLPSALYDPAHVQEIETMDGQTFDEEFYLLDLDDQGVCLQAARTFRTVT
jgi:hypothetical protein